MPQLSVAVGGVHVTTDEQLDPDAEIIISLGILLTSGFWLSTVDIFCTQDVERLELLGSVAVHVLCILKLLPLQPATAIIASLKVIIGVPHVGSLVVAEAIPVEAGAVLDPGHKVRLPGQNTIGA